MKTSILAKEVTIDMDNITARSSSDIVILPRIVRYRPTGSVPRIVDGNNAKVSYIVIQVEDNHFITNFL